MLILGDLPCWFLGSMFLDKENSTWNPRKLHFERVQNVRFFAGVKKSPVLKTNPRQNWTAGWWKESKISRLEKNCEQDWPLTFWFWILPGCPRKFVTIVSKLVYNPLKGLITYLYRGYNSQLLSTTDIQVSSLFNWVLFSSAKCSFSGVYINSQRNFRCCFRTPSFFAPGYKVGPCQL